MKESTASELAVGSSFGLVGGVMDNRYTEPFGLILGASLLILQLLTGPRGNVVAVLDQEQTAFTRTSTKRK